MIEDESRGFRYLQNVIPIWILSKENFELESLNIPKLKPGKTCKQTRQMSSSCHLKDIVEVTVLVGDEQVDQKWSNFAIPQQNCVTMWFWHCFGMFWYFVYHVSRFLSSRPGA